MNVRHLVPLFAALFLSCTARAANHDVTLLGGSFAPKDLTVAAGDTVTFRNPSGGLHNAVSDPGSPNMFRCANGCDGAGGSGSPSAADWAAVVTMTNTGVTPYFCEIHGGAGGVGMSGTITVTAVATAARPAPRDDRVRMRLGDDPIDIDVLANDVLDEAALAGGSLSIVGPPAQGVATVIDGGNAGTAADDVVRYSLAGTDDAVDTFLVYSICDATNQCEVGQVRILARGMRDEDLTVFSENDAGFVEVPIGTLAALPEARFQTTALLAPAALQPTIAADATPATPWDAGRAGTVLQMASIPAPADGLPQEFGIVVDTRPVGGGNVDLFVGLDLDGDLQPSEDELRCTSAMTATVERCEVIVEHPGTGALGYWMLLQNRSDAAMDARLESMHVPLRDGTRVLVMTGPGHMAAGDAAYVRLGWDDPGMVAGDVRMGFARVRPTPGTGLGWVPVRIDRPGGGDPVARALVSGRDQIVRVRPGEAHERIYVDVPPGATQLIAETASGSNFDLYVSHDASPSQIPLIDAAPARGSAVASATTPSGAEQVVVTAPELAPGRWYLTPVNVAGATDAVAVRATVTAAAPTVRSGSYFNPQRSGHGMFVYPAGGGAVWTVLWYHYFEDGSPTWYYLEGPAPGANGVFTSGVYRSAWDGDSNFVVQVGEATLTPTGPDAFAWSFTVDGQSGSETLSALGRGCPVVDTFVRDASSTWFDPTTAGTGYSTQLFPNSSGAGGYEYTAAFVYDGIGRPRYLAAELGTAGPSVHTYALEQLTGFCPTCPRIGAPSRQDIGTFQRTYVAGELTRVEVDAVYVDGIPGAWTGDDMVQPLGGADATQGCEL